MMRCLSILTVVACGITVCSAAELKYDDAPRGGYVPDAATAIQIAVAIWEPIYGKDQIAHEKPYKATLHDDIWTVTGSIPDGAMGGVAVAKISKKDGRIIGVTHTM